MNIFFVVVNGNDGSDERKVLAIHGRFKFEQLRGRLQFLALTVEPYRRTHNMLIRRAQAPILPAGPPISLISESRPTA